MDLKKSVGSFFKPRNIFSRTARVGGAAAGGAMGGPQGAQMGYQAGDSIAGLWEKEGDGEDSSSEMFSKGNIPGLLSGMTANLMPNIGGGQGDQKEKKNYFGRVPQVPEQNFASTEYQPANYGDDEITKLFNLLKMSGKL